MYLSELNEKQKGRFLDLGIILAAADNDFSEAEKKAIHLLCYEMRIKDRYKPEVSFEEAVQFFIAEADQHIRRVVILELLGIAIADSVYEAREQELIAKTVKAFSISDEEIKEISNTLVQLYELYVKISRFVNA